MMSKASAYAMVKYWKAKEAIKSFFEEERGDSHIIAVILVLVIVVGLALLFRKNIAKLLTDLWKNITDTTDNFKPEDVK
ncbi:MAG: hypothetical protein K1W24_00430 [Lachnospiraceae bacterium]